MTAGQVVRELRKGAGLSQRELAALLGVSENTVTRWESGNRKPPPYLRLAIEHVLEDAQERPAAEIK